MDLYFSPLKCAVPFPLTRLLLIPPGVKQSGEGELNKDTWAWQVFRTYSFSHGTIYGFVLFFFLETPPSQEILQWQSPSGGKCIS